MAENSSDSDSSCGWTVINHEGSDIEAVASEGEGPGGPTEQDPEELPPLLQESDRQEEPALDLQAEFGQGDVSSATDQSPSETTEAAQEEGAKGPFPEDGACLGALSDDSDIVTLEAPRAEEGLGSQSEATEAPVDDGPVASEGSDMGSSFSSQYTFCQPEAAFPPPPQESSSDEGPRSSPALRRRRAKKRPLSTSESEDTATPSPPPCEQEAEPQPPPRRTPFIGGSGLNRCILLALLVAVSMGFGHFYGTIQIQTRQQLVEKSHLDELKDVKEDLMHCQREQGSHAGCQEGLAACLSATEAEKEAFESQKRLLSSENLRLRQSLEKEEVALSSLQEELRRLRERVRLLDEERGPHVAPHEAQRLKAHREEEQQQRRAQGFVRQKAALMAEAQMLRRELDKERRAAVALREEVERMSAAGKEREQEAEAQETERLKGRLAELEKRLRFEEQRSDLWEKLYVEAKAQQHPDPHPPPPPEPKDRSQAKKKPPPQPPKSSFFGSVKETLDAMKNSTKAFVRHHKEKIKRAKEAVKENLRRFSDSVKSTFRHFKDSTRTATAFEGKRRHGEKRRQDRKGRHHEQQQQQRDPGGHGDGKRCPGNPGNPGCERKGPLPPQQQQRDPRGHGDGKRCPGNPGNPGCERQGPLPSPPPTGCLGIFDCARQEFAGLFDRVLGPIRADEFQQLMHKFLQQEVGGFRHWGELEAFLGRFFRNGVFIHDQMLFADFVNDVKDYLQHMEEYRRGGSSAGAGAFGDLDTYIYRYYFHYEPAPEHHGHSHPAKKTQPERSPPKTPHHHHHPQRQKREGGGWQKEGRHTASLEIEVGQMPFHPTY